MRNVTGNNTWGGTITLSGNASIQSDSGRLVLSASNAVKGSYNLTLQGAGNGIISGSITTGNRTLTKDGTGRWTLAGINTYTGQTTIKGGALEATIGAGIPASSFLILDGGVYQSESSSVNFTRGLGSSGDTFQWTINGGGFSAGSGPMTVNVGGSGATLTWGSNLGSNIVGKLKFGSSTAANVTTFQNPVDLNGADRTIQVDDNPLSTADYAVMSGPISNDSGMAGLVKTGDGILSLAGVNTYNGATTIAAGTLALSDLGTLASTMIDVGSGATFNVSEVSGGWSLGTGQTLKGSGTIVGNLTVNGIHVPEILQESRRFRGITICWVSFKSNWRGLLPELATIRCCYP